MDDTSIGTRDKRGNWTPNKPLQIAPFWEGRWPSMLPEQEALPVQVLLP